MTYFIFKLQYRLSPQLSNRMHLSRYQIQQVRDQASSLSHISRPGVWRRKKIRNNHARQERLFCPPDSSGQWYRYYESKAYVYISLLERTPDGGRTLPISLRLHWRQLYRRTGSAVLSTVYCRQSGERLGESFLRNSVMEPVHFWPAPAPNIFFPGSDSGS